MATKEVIEHRRCYCGMVATHTVSNDFDRTVGYFCEAHADMIVETLNHPIMPAVDGGILVLDEPRMREE